MHVDITQLQILHVFYCSHGSLNYLCTFLCLEGKTHRVYICLRHLTFIGCHQADGSVDYSVLSCSVNVVFLQEFHRHRTLLIIYKILCYDHCRLHGCIAEMMYVNNVFQYLRTTVRGKLLE